MQGAFPHLQSVSGDAEGTKACMRIIHHYSVEARFGVAFKICHWCFGVGTHVIMQSFGESSVLAFATWASVLSNVSQLLACMVKGCTASKQYAENKIEVGFEEVYNTQLFDVDAVHLFVYHYVNDLGPSGKEEAMVGSRGC